MPAPARASLHPLLRRDTARASQGGTVGTRGLGQAHATRTHRARTAACKWRCGRQGSAPQCQLHPHRPYHRAPPPRNCSNGPRCRLIAIATAMHELPGEEACLAGGREARGASGYGGQSRFSLTWLPHPAAYGVVKPLSLETSPVPQVVPLQAPSVVSGGEEVRPEDGGAASLPLWSLGDKDLVPPPPEAACGPKVDPCPAKRAQATLTDGDMEAQTLGSYSPPAQAFPGAPRAQGKTSTSQAQGCSSEA